jgi:peroxiredoxin
VSDPDSEDHRKQQTSQDNSSRGFELFGSRGSASRRYVGFAASVFFIVVVVAAVNAFNNTGKALDGPPLSAPLPQFAAPAAGGHLRGDANVRQPQQDSQSAGREPACDVRGTDVVNSCDLASRPLVLTLIATRATDCAAQLDTMEAIRSQFKDVTFAAVVSGDDPASLGRLKASHHWNFPVAADHDGAVADLYRVGVCPTTVFATHGEVRTVKLGMLDQGKLRAALADLR